MSVYSLWIDYIDTGRTYFAVSSPINMVTSSGFARLSLDVFGQEIQGPLPGELGRLRVMELTGFVAEPMLGLIAIKFVIHLPLL